MFIMQFFCLDEFLKVELWLIINVFRKKKNKIEAYSLYRNFEIC